MNTLILVVALLQLSFGYPQQQLIFRPLQDVPTDPSISPVSQPGTVFNTNFPNSPASHPGVNRDSPFTITPPTLTASPRDPSFRFTPGSHSNVNRDPSFHFTPGSHSNVNRDPSFHFTPDSQSNVNRDPSFHFTPDSHSDVSSDSNFNIPPASRTNFHGRDRFQPFPSDSSTDLTHLSPVTARGDTRNTVFPISHSPVYDHIDGESVTDDHQRDFRLNLSQFSYNRNNDTAYKFHAAGSAAPLDTHTSSSESIERNWGISGSGPLTFNSANYFLIGFYCLLKYVRC